MNNISVEIPLFKKEIKFSFNLLGGINMLFILFNAIELCLLGDASLSGDALKLLVSTKT